jgi:hypothetical protein
MGLLRDSQAPSWIPGPAPMYRLNSLSYSLMVFIYSSYRIYKNIKIKIDIKI